MTAVEVSHLVVRYGQFTAVDDVSFQVDAGEVVALLGPNGAGKTTTVETLEGFRRPQSGQVRILGLDPLRDRDRVTPQMGVMLQEGGVYPAIRAREILELYAAFFRSPEDPTTLLDRVGLTRRANATWRQLSGGEKQRLSLAMALIGRPKVAILDEPTAGVDIDGRQLVRQVVRQLAADGAAVLLTTHDLTEAEKTVDRMVIISSGRVVASGTAEMLLSASPMQAIRFSAPGGIDTDLLGKAMATKVTETVTGHYVLHSKPTPAKLASLTEWLAQHDLLLRELSTSHRQLEDVFLELTAPETPMAADIQVLAPGTAPEGPDPVVGDTQ